MNREIKLALTVGLMNIHTSNHLHTIQDLMQNLAGQVGDFLGLRVLNNDTLDKEHSIQTLALQYENCTLNIDLIENMTTHSQYVNRLEVV